jgi:hypothetical protein
MTGALEATRDAAAAEAQRAIDAAMQLPETPTAAPWWFWHHNCSTDGHDGPEFLLRRPSAPPITPEAFVTLVMLKLC